MGPLQMASFMMGLLGVINHPYKLSGQKAPYPYNWVNWTPFAGHLWTSLILGSRSMLFDFHDVANGSKVLKELSMWELERRTNLFRYHWILNWDGLLLMVMSFHNLKFWMTIFPILNDGRIPGRNSVRVGSYQPVGHHVISTFLKCCKGMWISAYCRVY